MPQSSAALRFARASFAICAFLLGAAFAGAQTYNEIYDFGSTGNGTVPGGQLVFDRSGNMYGVTGGGGTHGYGTVFELSPASGGSWTETVLYNFTGGIDGGDPYSGITIDSSGNLYGATYFGGSPDCGCGTVFKMKPPAVKGGAWGFRTMYRFLGGTTDGFGPVGPVTLDKAGNLYGTTFSGGTYIYTSASGFSGTVYKVTPAGGGWTESVLWNFGGPGDGAYTYSGLVLDSVGNLYGTTQNGGTSGWGTIFEVSPPASGSTTWTESLLYNFPAAGKVAGNEPLTGLVADSHGNLFGTASGLDDTHPACCGSIYRLSPASGGGWTFKVLSTVITSDNGYNPGGLAHDAKSNTIYGVAIQDSAISGNGVVFQVTPAGSSWDFSITHDFNGTSESDPQSPPIIGPDGNIYGTTEYGGTYGGGVVYQIVP